MVNNAAEDPRLKAQTFKARFLEPGVVQYEDEMVLIKPENLMTIAMDFKGVHVIVDHQDIDAANVEEIVGYITNIWIESDGWAWCDFTVNNDDALTLINNGYSVSCAYVPGYAEGGIYHNIPYDREIISGEAIHLAIVENPRYEDAIIIKNSIKKKIMTIFKSKKKESKVQEIDMDNAVFELEGGETVPVMNMMEAYKNAKDEEEKEAKKNEDDEKESKVNASDEFEVNGEMVKVSELAKAYKAAKKNAEEEEAKKNAEEEEEKKNEEEEKEKEKKEAKKNSVDAESIKAAKAKFENGVPSSEPSKQIVLDKDRFALGAALYGSAQKVEK